MCESDPYCPCPREDYQDQVTSQLKKLTPLQKALYEDYKECGSGGRTIMFFNLLRYASPRLVKEIHRINNE